MNQANYLLGLPKSLTWINLGICLNRPEDGMIKQVLLIKKCPWINRIKCCPYNDHFLGLIHPKHGSFNQIFLCAQCSPNLFENAVVTWEVTWSAHVNFWRIELLIQINEPTWTNMFEPGHCCSFGRSQITRISSVLSYHMNYLFPDLEFRLNLLLIK